MGESHYHGCEGCGAPDCLHWSNFAGRLKTQLIFRLGSLGPLISWSCYILLDLIGLQIFEICLQRICLLACLPEQLSGGLCLCHCLCSCLYAHRAQNMCTPWYAYLCADDEEIKWTNMPACSQHTGICACAWILYDMIWYHIVWHDMTWHDMI